MSNTLQLREKEKSSGRGILLCDLCWKSSGRWELTILGYPTGKDGKLERVCKLCVQEMRKVWEGALDERDEDSGGARATG